jgi:hypothetical protein
MDVERIIDEIEQLQEISKRRIGHSARATSLRRIDGTTKCSRIALGFGFGSSTGFAAEVNPKAGFGFRVKRRFAVSAIHFVYQSECGDQPPHLRHCV